MDWIAEDEERRIRSWISCNNGEYGSGRFLALVLGTAGAMPAGQDAMLEPPLMHSYPNSSAASILQSVKEQEAQFEHLTRQLEVERQTVASQLEKVWGQCC